MFIFSNLATSLDGKIATSGREHFPLGSPSDLKKMMALRKKCDAIIMGAGTLRAYRRFCGIPGSKKQPMNIVVSSKLEGISPDWAFFKTPSRSRVLFVGPDAQARKVEAFKTCAQVIHLTRRTPIAMQIVRHLEKLGVKKLLVEGGGGLMWDFVSQDLIDEYHVTLTPRLLGGRGAPTLVDGPGFIPSKALNLELKRCQRIGDELYLVYQKTGRRG